MGVPRDIPYMMNPDMLVRHAFITGTTGSGKSTTCKQLLQELMHRDIPFLIIEPAKDDYVRWAQQLNETLPEKDRIHIYAPGGEVIFPEAEPLHLNLFEPAAPKGEKVNLLQHSEMISMLINACLPSEEVIPILIDETINRVVMEFSEGLDVEDFEPIGFYPNIDVVLSAAKDIIRAKKYDDKVRENMGEILNTRFQYLKRGTRGKVLNAKYSTDFDDLFGHSTVINLSFLAESKEKSLIMSMLLLALYEYRNTMYRSNRDYRRKARQNKLMHLTMVEEAHNVLSALPANLTGSDPRQAAADLFSNILSEIRYTGEGLAIVDQSPVKMIPDVIKNTNLKICHRLVAADDCEAMSACLALREDQRSLIPALEIGNAILCGDLDDAATWVRIPAPKNRK